MPPIPAPAMDDLINPTDSIERQNEKLMTIARVLMQRVEQVTNDGGAAYAQFQRAVMLEDQVRARTRDLERALDLLNQSNAQLSIATREAETARATLTGAIETIQEGFGLFDADDRMVLCNSRFGMFMPEMKALLLPGLSFYDYVRAASRSSALELPRELNPDQWADRRRRRHGDSHAVFNVALKGDRWIQVSEHRTNAGQTVILQTDITDVMRQERRERERILDHQSRLIAATLEHLDQGVCVFDEAGVLVAWNSRVREILSLPVKLLRAGTPLDAILKATRDFSWSELSVEEIAAWVARKDARPPLRFDLSQDAGSILKVHARETPDRGLVFSITDVTAERHAAQELLRAKETLERRVVERTLELEDALSAAERANASKTRFVAAASHDLLQPLSAAKLFISSLPGEPQGVAMIGERALSALTSVETMLEALLDISKLETAEYAFDVEPVDLGKLLRKLGDEFAPLAAQKGLGFRVVPGVATIETDPGYFRRIVQNLIANAIRHTASGRVLVGTRRRGQMVRVEIRDTGPGIPEDQQEEIFKEFHQLKSRASASEGLGLGLAIVERACARLGHPLGLVSIPGRGSCFSVTAQRAKETGRQENGFPGSGAAGGRGRGKMILLVDDDRDMREALSVSLRSLGHRVMSAGSGDEALARLAAAGERPEMLILDFRIGETETAFDLLPRIQAAIGRTPCCLLTADRGHDVIDGARARGIPILFKPTDLAALAEVVGG